MTVLEEGSLRLTLPGNAEGRRFDGENHGLSHCMKAVDFIVETPERLLFIEFKDLDDPRVAEKNRKAFVEELKAGRQDDGLVRKYRDSFLYQWACDALKKPVTYCILIALDRLDEALLAARTDDLKRKLPLHGPNAGTWKRRIVADCGVFNLDTWNKCLKDFPVVRK